jgi:hypothetical protein
MTTRNIDQLSAILGHPIKPHRIASLGLDVITWQDAHVIEIEENEIAIQGERIAWLERCYPTPETHIEEDFRLKAMINRALIVDWPVTVYNPAFGCDVYLLRWFGEVLVFIYHDKHDLYACNFNANGLIKCRCISHELAILQDQVVYRNWGERDKVHVLGLPDLDLQETIRYEEARARGITLDELGSQNWYAHHAV